MSDDTPNAEHREIDASVMPIAGPTQRPGVLGPFRTAMLRDWEMFLSPLLTVVILVWVWQTLKYYMLELIAATARSVAQKSAF